MFFIWIETSALSPNVSMWEIQASKINMDFESWGYGYSRESQKNIFWIFFSFIWISFTDEQSEFCVESWHDLPNTFRADRENWLCTFVIVFPHLLMCRLRHLLSILLFCSILVIFLSFCFSKIKQLHVSCVGSWDGLAFHFLLCVMLTQPPHFWVIALPLHGAINHRWNS